MTRSWRSAGAGQHRAGSRFRQCRIARSPSAGLDVHMILDNYATHRHATVQAWLDKHLRFHLHFTPNFLVG